MGESATQGKNQYWIHVFKSQHISSPNTWHDVYFPSIRREVWCMRTDVGRTGKHWCAFTSGRYKEGGRGGEVALAERGRERKSREKCFSIRALSL